MSSGSLRLGVEGLGIWGGQAEEPAVMEGDIMGLWTPKRRRRGRKRVVIRKGRAR